MKKGKLFLIPSTMGAYNAELVIPAGVMATTRRLRHYIAENPKTARRFLKSVDAVIPLDDLKFGVLNKNTQEEELMEMAAPLLKGTDMGLISEAGQPCIADPGASIVSLCHDMGVQVVPASGPSSIILALSASGFNGQEFSFHGYLPIDRKARSQKIRQLESDLNRSGQTQIFMETPYRNEKLVAQLIDNCQAATQLCVATDLTLNSERITTRSLEEWEKHPPKIHKRYCIFLIGKRK